MLLYLRLFLNFARIGVCGFGGYSMVSMITQTVTGYGWMTPEEVLDIIAIAEMTPGSLGINAATFSGMRTAFLPGAIFATLGIMTTSLTLTMAVAAFLEKWKENKYWKWVLYGIRPICIALILNNMVTLLDGNYIINGILSWRALLIGALVTAGMLKWKLTIPKIIISAAVLGLIFG